MSQEIDMKNIETIIYYIKRELIELDWIQISLK